MEFHHLKSILNDLIIRVEHRNYPHEFELKRELDFLNQKEKRLLKSKIVTNFQQNNFSHGNLRVIKILKDVNIISMCDYLQENLKDATEIINMLIDQPIENFNLFQEVLSSDKFCSQVYDCMKQYFQEIIDHPEWERVEMISSTSQLVPTDLYQSSILKPCLEFLLKHDLDNKSNLTDAITNQRQWNDEMTTECDGWKYLEIFKHVLPLHAEFIVSELITTIENEERINWFFTLMIIKLVHDHNDLKKLTKNFFVNFRNINCTKSLYKSIILARQIFHYSLEKSKYDSWVRDNISEMKYCLKKDTEIFANLIQSLQNMIEFENDAVIIGIHLSCPISAPNFKYQHVREYKQVLKSKLES